MKISSELFKAEQIIISLLLLFLTISSKTRGQNLKKMAQRFQVVTHFHPGHPWLNTLIVSIISKVTLNKTGPLCRRYRQTVTFEANATLEFQIGTKNSWHGSLKILSGMRIR